MFNFFAIVSIAFNKVIHKQNTRIRANFGTRPFAFAEGQQHKEAADAANDLSREIRESFGHLPFHPHSDSESEGSPQPSPDTTATENLKTPKGPPCKTAAIPKAQSGKNQENISEIEHEYYSYILYTCRPKTEPFLKLKSIFVMQLQFL